MKAEATLSAGAQISGQARRFIIVGTLAVMIDYVSYRSFLSLGMELDPAKFAGFTTGAVFAFFANKQYTFRVSADGRLWSMIVLFCLLYLFSMTVNVTVNSLINGMLEGVAFVITIAFVVATGISATLNFLGMKFLVYRQIR